MPLRYLTHTIFFLLTFSTIKATEWLKYTVNGAFSFEVPNSIELRTNNDPYTKDMLKRHGFVINSDNIVFQQKNLSINNEDALLNQYCRIIIHYQKGKSNEYLSSNEDYTLTNEDIESIKSIIESDAAERLISIESIRYENNTQFSGIIAEYRRKGYGNNPPVRVQYQFIYNNDEFVTFVLSYREAEKEIWENDFKKVMASFQWINKKVKREFNDNTSTYKKEKRNVSSDKDNKALTGFLFCSLLFIVLYYISRKK